MFPKLIRKNKSNKRTKIVQQNKKKMEERFIQVLNIQQSYNEEE